MNKFVIRSIILILPIIVILNIPKFTHYTFHTDIKKKINSLIEKNDEPIIIVGGDSRAERQIIPDMIEERIDMEAVNIGATGAGIAVLYNALEHHEIINPLHTLIISISSVELNDCVVDKWGRPQAYITYFTTLESVKLYGIRYINMMHERLILILKELFKIEKNTVLHNSDTRLYNKGFLGVEGDMSKFDFASVDIYSNTLKTPWYIEAEHNGVRKNVFLYLIKKLASTKMNIIIFQPPVSPGWYNITKSTYIDSIELNHSKFLENVANQYDNISFIDFYTKQNSTFRDSMFYNSIHFNCKGSEIFTETLLDTLQIRELIN